MNKRGRIAAFMTTLTFLTIGIVLAKVPCYPTDSPSTLPQISEFYEDYNFVATFSTPAERDVLIDHFAREALPEEIRNDRVNKVFRLMKKLYSRITRIDPGMVEHMGPPNSAIKYFFNTELLDVVKIDRSGEKAVVEVSAYRIGPEFVNRYIQQYETDGNGEKKIPSDEERIESVKGRSVPVKEFHIWLFRGGQWMKAEHKNIYIKK